MASSQPSQRSPIEFSVPISIGTLGASLVVAAVSGQRIMVTRIMITGSAANAVKLQSNTTDITGPIRLIVDGSIYFDAAAGNGRPIAATNSGEALNINLAAADAVGGYLLYQLVS